MNGLDVGVQFHLPTHRSRTVPELRDLARRCADAGVDQVWVTDNLGSRNLFVVLAALSAVSIDLGAAVMVQYFRSPLEAASALASVSELMGDRELSVGLGRGNPSTALMIETPRAVAFLRETAECLRALWSGATVTARSYPLVAQYFRLVPEASFNLSFAPSHPIRVYGGGSGPLSLKVARSSMDGIIFNGTMFLPMLSLGRLAGMLGTGSGQGEDVPSSLGRRVASVKISVHSDPEVARGFVRPSVATRITSLKMAGLGDAELAALGVDPGEVDALVRERESGASASDLAAAVDDAMIDAVFIAGDPGYCRHRLAEVAAIARDVGFDQLMFSELGPDPEEAVHTLLEEVLAGL